MDIDLEHPVRSGLLDLLAVSGTITSNEAARRLGVSSGLTSFHLRQLARAGLVEAAPAPDRRARPWRLATASPEPSNLASSGLGNFVSSELGNPQSSGLGNLESSDLGDLGRDLEDEAYRRWSERRAESGLPDEAFSAVIWVAPEDLTDIANAIRAVLAPYRREDAAGPAVGAIVRLFPLLPED